MKSFRRLCFAVVLASLLALPVVAGDVYTPGWSGPGEILTPGQKGDMGNPGKKGDLETPGKYGDIQTPTKSRIQAGLVSLLVRLTRR